MATEGPGAGILVVDKTVGPTSHDVVARVRRALGVRRVGHCGTLDPLATGVLVVCVGSYTRLNDWLSRGGKEYEATFRLGAESDTDDALGSVQEVAGAAAPTRDRIEAALPAFRGTIDQVPPDHSAVKVDGVRSYRRARRQESVELAPRPVRVDRFEVVDFEFPHLLVRVECGKGTYIRSLARDLGRALGCGAHVEQLRRTRVGVLGIDDAVDWDALERGAGVDFADPRHALSGVLEAVDIDAEAARAFLHGNPVEATGAPGERAVFADGDLLGVGRADGDGWLQPVKVLGAPSAVG